MMRFIKSTFTLDTKATIGSEFLSKSVMLPAHKKQVWAQVWDTAGQEKYRSATRLFYKGAAGALLVFDITERKSFDAVEERIAEIYEECGEDCAVILVGNKVDRENERAVTYEDAMSFALLHDIPYMETSAKDDINVENVFVQVLNGSLR
eukprot:TRINITY_DN3000_c0_g2_i2.p1 TRINITY_DN3000_c0_g2~~TRINITY_DN3000_c0_g2_i2.p1  ORF type:complete len:150 (+),score=30.85 TRINITY_DN3000_c0_g2_i2:190-639(+)